jgi:RNA polymerase sigma-70 factor (ECF subfamily)
MKIIELENNSETFMENDTFMYLNNIEDKNKVLEKALSNLNDEQRTCIDLFYYKQKTYQEVASITGYDLNKVKSAIQNGKRNLKIFMEEKRDFYE